MTVELLLSHSKHLALRPYTELVSVPEANMDFEYSNGGVTGVSVIACDYNDRTFVIRGPFISRIMIELKSMSR